MARPKARYSAPSKFWGVADGDSPPTVRDFSNRLKERLRRFHEESVARKHKFHSIPTVDDEWFGSSAERFVDEVLAEARFVFGELKYLRQSGNKPDIQAEHRNLAKRLRATINRIEKYPRSAQDKGSGDLADCLLRISPDLERLLEVNADPRRCAEILQGFRMKEVSPSEVIGVLKELSRQVADAGVALAKMRGKRRERELQHEVAVRLAAEILPVLERNLLSITSYGSGEHDHASDAVKILQAIGEEAGLALAPKTWADAIAKSKVA